MEFNKKFLPNFQTTTEKCSKIKNVPKATTCLLAYFVSMTMIVDKLCLLVKLRYSKIKTDVIFNEK